jgi:hypothetical protein
LLETINYTEIRKKALKRLKIVCLGAYCLITPEIWVFVTFEGLSRIINILSFEYYSDSRTFGNGNLYECQHPATIYLRRKRKL